MLVGGNGGAEGLVVVMFAFIVMVGVAWSWLRCFVMFRVGAVGAADVDTAFFLCVLVVGGGVGVGAGSVFHVAVAVGVLLVMGDDGVVGGGRGGRVLRGARALPQIRRPQFRPVPARLVNTAMVRL